MKKYFNFCLLLLYTYTAAAQSVELLPDSKTNLSLPQFSYQQILAIQNPNKGSLVYDSTARCVRMYNGLTWNCLHRNGTNTPEFSAAWKPSGDSGSGAFSYELDNAGNIYVCGYTYSTILFGNNVSIPSVENMSFFIVKYSPEGKALWVRNSTGSGYGFIRHMKIGTDSKLYFVASYGGAITFSPYYGADSESNQSLLIGKMDLNGNVEWGTTAYGNTQGLIANSLALDSQNNIYVAGNFTGQVHFSSFPGSSTILTQAPGSSTNGFYLKYSPIGDWLWAKSLYSTQGFQISDLQVDTNGDIYMGAFFTGSTTVGSVISSAGDFDILLLKADNAGNVLWGRREGGTRPETEPKLALVNGNIFVLGSVIAPSNIGGVNLNPSVPPEFGDAKEMFYGLFNPNTQTWNYVKKSDNGAVFSSNTFKTDSQGSFYASGSYTPSLKFDNMTITEPTYGNAFYVKGSMLTGNILHLNGYSSPSAGDSGISYGLYKNNVNLLLGAFFWETKLGEYKLRADGNSFFIGKVEE